MIIKLSRRRTARVAASLSVALFVLFLSDGLFYPLLSHGPVDSIATAGYVSHRKLLQHGIESNAGGGGDAAVCGKEDVVVYQGATAPLPNGIPTYTVEVLNVCAWGCAVARVHVRCGWFSSARLVNPRLFRRLRFGDCLLNDGRPIPAGSSLSFQYANSFPYPLAVSSAQCLPSS